VKVALLAPSLTVSEAGTLTSPLLLESVTTTPPAGATLVSVTEQLAAPGARTISGLHDRPETAAGAFVAVRANEKFAEPPFALAVMVAVALLVIAPAVAVKVALDAPSGTFTGPEVVRAA
jgi:hypothetical protein